MKLNRFEVELQADFHSFSPYLFLLEIPFPAEPIHVPLLPWACEEIEMTIISINNSFINLLLNI